MRMRVFSAPTIIRTVLGAWRLVVPGAAVGGDNKAIQRPDFTPRPTALAAALLMDGVR